MLGRKKKKDPKNLNDLPGTKVVGWGPSPSRDERPRLQQAQRQIRELRRNLEEIGRRPDGDQKPR